MSEASLRARHLVPEEMDDPTLAPEELHRILRGLARVNRISMTARSLWDVLAPWIAAHGGPEPFRVLDVACGAGDVTARLQHLANHRFGPGRAIIDGCDRNPLAVDASRRRNAAAHPEASQQFYRLDVPADPLPTGYDAIVSSLFVHHLPDAQARCLLQQAGKAARYVALTDLRRCRLGLWMATSVSWLLSGSRIMACDADRSVRSSFTPAELHTIAQDAGLCGAQVWTIAPCRMLLAWENNAIGASAACGKS